MSRLRGRRVGVGNDWTWERSDDTRPLVKRVWPVVALVLAPLLVVVLASFGGDAKSSPLSSNCSDSGIEVAGALTGDIQWCGTANSTVTDVLALVAVHYPGNKNPCGFPEERGPGDSWFEPPGSYNLSRDGPAVPGLLASATWTYSIVGSISLCGGENSMRVTIVALTDLGGAIAWSGDFGPGAFGSRTESFPPAGLPTPTPT